MAVPPQIFVRYRFAPDVAADWNAAEFDAFDPPTAVTTLTGASDPFVIAYWHSNDVNAYGYLGQNADVSALGEFYVMRLRCTLTISTLPNYDPPDTSYALLGWDWEPQIAITPAGNLCFRYYDETVSVGALAAGTAYNIEVYVASKRSDPNYLLWQIYVDGDLWLEMDAAAEGYDIADYWDALFLFIGFGSGVWVTAGTAIETLTIANVAWTIEDEQIGPGHWTMLALL
jgi:hypothetical protein